MVKGREPMRPADQRLVAVIIREKHLIPVLQEALDPWGGKKRKELNKGRGEKDASTLSKRKDSGHKKNGRRYNEKKKPFGKRKSERKGEQIQKINKKKNDNVKSGGEIALRSETTGRKKLSKRKRTRGAKKSESSLQFTKRRDKGVYRSKSKENQQSPTTNAEKISKE